MKIHISVSPFIFLKMIKEDEKYQHDYFLYILFHPLIKIKLNFSFAHMLYSVHYNINRDLKKKFSSGRTLTAGPVSPLRPRGPGGPMGPGKPFAPSFPEGPTGPGGP